MFSCLRLSSSSLVGTIFELLPVEWRRVFIEMCETFLITNFEGDSFFGRIWVSWGSSEAGLGWIGTIFLTATAINLGVGFCLTIWVSGGITAGVSVGGFGWICWSFRFDWTRRFFEFEGYNVIFDVDLAVCQTGTSFTTSYSSSCFSCLISVNGGRFKGASVADPLLPLPVVTAA